MRRRQPIVCLAAATLALLVTGAGQAAPPQELKEQTTFTSQAAPKPERGGGLPFSGIDLALLMAGGGPLLLIGVSLRRRPPKPSVQPASEETLTLA